MIRAIASRTHMAVTRSMAATNRLMSTADKLVLEDDPCSNMFKMKLNSDYATVDYTLCGDTYNLHHSYVPEAYQGKGLGGVLAKKTFDLIVSKNKKMKIECEYLQTVYEKNKSKYQVAME